MRARIWLPLGAALVVGAGAVAASGLGGSSGTRSAASALPPATAKVTRATLTETEDVAGLLGYGDPTPVTGQVHGTLTALPALGATIQRGQTLYRVDDTPVVLLYGSLPAYRRLAPGTSGADVRQFESELRAIGYTGFAVDDDYTSSTADAVKRWQDRLGLTRTGVVEPGRVVYAPSAIRVSALPGRVGEPATGQLLSYTGTSRLVTVHLDAGKQDLAVAGSPATVKLPSGGTVPGTVATIGSVATSVTGNGQTTTTFDITVTVADQAGLGRYDEAPVTVTMVAAKREDVLTVPVGALLALAEGGYGIQVVENGTTRILAVKTGLFANGRVEISGDGVTAGLTVGVPA